MAVRRPPPNFWPTIGVVAVAAGLFLITPYALLMMAPALALAWLVAVGLFTGEHAASWVRRAVRRFHRPMRPGLARRPMRAPRELPRGGRLLATALASRPPPVIA